MVHELIDETNAYWKEDLAKTVKICGFYKEKTAPIRFHITVRSVNISAGNRKALPRFSVSEY
jgi:hypothetical protein